MILTDSDKIVTTPYLRWGKYAPLVRLFNSNARLYSKRYLIAFLMMGLTAVTTSASAYIIKNIINGVFINKEINTVFLISFAIIIIYLVKGLSTYFASIILTSIGNSIIASMQRAMYANLLRQDVAYFERYSAGDLVARISQNAQSARQALDLTVIAFGRDATTVVALVAIMVLQNPLLSLSALVILPLAVFAIARLVKQVRSAAQREVASIGRIITLIQETVRGIRVVKAFGLEHRLTGATGQVIGDVEAQANRMSRLAAMTSPLMELLGGLAIAGVVLFGGLSVIRYNGDPGAFFSFITALLLAYEPAKRLARLHVDLEAVIVGVRMMYEILDHRPELTDRTDAIDVTFDACSVRFEGVSFAYGDRPVLDDITIEAPAGQVIALVGPSGAGKSTLFALLERFYDPSSGSIQINGTDIRDLKLDCLRRHIAFVTQDTFLFDGTIAANIADGRPDATREEIIAAARAANAYDFIMANPDGFDARVGDSGQMFSGGQRQRLAIARALLRDAPILLLDEATSALDSRAEAEVQSAMNRLMEGRTTLVIAHRLATVRDANVIYVLDDGKIVQFGTHEMLLASGGLYAELCARQFQAAATLAPVII